MRAAIELSVDVTKTARVLQMAGMFDVPIDERNVSAWQHSLPIEERDWNVGLIVGPSGSGKSVLARQLWPERVRDRFEWPADESILDAFPSAMSIRDITGLLTGVGLGSAPAWVRPYRVLSNGEQFRADMARAIATDDDPIVVDEFTSVVDRQVARVASFTVQKVVRREKRQLVAVTCHYDVHDWLQPDWVYDVAALTFSWRSVQPRPTMRLEVFAATAADWKLFARHHYLSTTLNASAKCFVAYIDGVPVAFTSYRHFPHAHTRNIKIGHRTVVLPDWQGLGIQGVLADWLGQHLWERGYRYRRVIAHPSIIRYCEKSPRWQDTGPKATRLMTTTKTVGLAKANLNPRRLSARSFEYRPPKGAADVATA